MSKLPPLVIGKVGVLDCLLPTDSEGGTAANTLNWHV